MGGVVVTFLFLAVATQGFSVLFFGADMAREAVFIDPDFPPWEDPTSGRDCANDHWFDFDPLVCIGIWVGYAVKFAVLWVVAALKLAMVIIWFLIKAITFDIPGAPWEIRVPVTVLFVGGIGWPLAQFFMHSRGE